jgi:hypothetical protein
MGRLCLLNVHKINRKIQRYGVPLIAASSLFIIAEAVYSQVLIEIKQVGSDVVITAAGSLQLPVSMTMGLCGNNEVLPVPVNGAIKPDTAAVCIGKSDQQGYIYSITGPATFLGGSDIFTRADSSTGQFFGLGGNIGLIGSEYYPNTPFTSTSTYNNTTLTALGITQLGELGKWDLLDRPMGNPIQGQTITVVATPAPLAALGLPITYGWTLRMRRRIRAAAGQQGA